MLFVYGYIVVASLVPSYILMLEGELPVTKVEADNDLVVVLVRGHLYQFSISMINEFLTLPSLPKKEEDVEATMDAVTST